jgi:hypothetical protein
MVAHPSMEIAADKKPEFEAMEIEDISQNASQQTMTKAVWLACIALGLSYTTSFQQNACTAAIVKHIDTELGTLSREFLNPF